MKILILLLTSVLALTACETNQDPLAGQPGPVKNGQVPDPADTNQKIEPLDKNAFRIHVSPDRVVSGRVGSQIEIKIEGRLMVDGVPFEIIIANLADFPGATFDSASGLFSWTPQKADMNGELTRQFPLRVLMRVIPSEVMPIESFETENVYINVTNNRAEPIIKSVTLTNNQVLAGQISYGEAIVEDLDAYSTDQVRLMPVDCRSSGGRSISHMVSVSRVNQGANPNEYKVNFSLNLLSADTFPAGSYCFSFVAMSKFGVLSKEMSRSVTVEGRVRDTVASLKDVTVPVNSRTTYNFTVYDPLGNGELSVISMDDIAKTLPGSSFACATSSVRSQLLCELTVVAGPVPTSPSLPLYVRYSVQNLNPRMPTMKITTTHSMRVNIKAAN